MPTVEKNAKIVLFVLLLLVMQMNDLFSKNRDTLSVKSVEFIQNRGQWEPQVLYKMKLSQGSLFMEKDLITFVLLNQNQLYPSHYRQQNAQPHTLNAQWIDACAYKMRFINANPDVKVIGNAKKKHYENYFIGNDPSKWASFVPVFEELYYRNIYENIDLSLNEHHGCFKYEFEIKPGANPKDIVLQFDGIEKIALRGENLLLHTAIGTITELKPYTYQLYSSGDTVEIACRYLVHKNRVEFEVGNYDPKLPLIIDPILVFSTFSGSLSDNWGFTATYDKQGEVYAGGVTFGVGYPTTIGAYQLNYGGGDCDISISKFSSDGSSLLYATYVGGTSIEIPNSMIVSENDELYVLATSGSADFPVTANAYCTTFKGGTSREMEPDLYFSQGSDIAVFKLNTAGSSLLASTFIGGTENDGMNTSARLKYNYGDAAKGEILLDKNQNVYIVSSTFSEDFPTTEGAFQTGLAGGQDACIVKLNYSLSNMIWSSFLGGSGNDAGYSLTVVEDNSIYVCGGTNSADFPTTYGVIQPQFSNTSPLPDGFITHISEFGFTLLQSTYLGSVQYDQIYQIKSDKQNNIYIAGQTEASGDTWIQNVLWYNVAGKQFISKINPTLSQVVWSTAFGRGNPRPDISITALTVDICGNLYLSGWGNPATNGFGGTSGLPITPDAFQTVTDNKDFYFLCLEKDANSLLYATFFGSTTTGTGEHVDGGTSRFDSRGTIYQAVCAGCGGYSSFPTTPNAYSTTNNSTNCNLAVVKLDFHRNLIIADFSIPSVICFLEDVIPENRTQFVEEDSIAFFWNFGDGTTSTLQNPSHQYVTSGQYLVTLIVSSHTSCNLSDTLSKWITVLANSRHSAPPIQLCYGSSVQIGFIPAPDNSVFYSWTPSWGLNDSTISNPVASPESTTTYSLVIQKGLCIDTIDFTVNIDHLEVIMPHDTVICRNETVVLTPLVFSADELCQYSWSDSPLFDHILNSSTSESSLTVTPTVSTIYYLSVIRKSCIVLSSVVVRVSEIESNPDDFSLCFEDAIYISANAQCIECEHIDYLWQSHPYIRSALNLESILVNPETDTYFIVNMTNEYGCHASASVFVQKQYGTFEDGLQAWSIVDTVIQGQSTTLFSTQYDYQYHYQWNPTTGLEHPNAAVTVATPIQTTEYAVIVTDRFGCRLIDTVKLTVIPMICGEPIIFVPSAFTPNGDGKNDVLYARGSVVNTMLFRVFNRWGELVFESQNLQDGWDGKYKGMEAPEGVYDYFLSVTCINGETFVKKGNITLIR
ncbi:MAG: gliding motility-associated C-terminal domain-containing protein [Bacteroidales bacterium]|jgi:gliding motility-associated-like protein|nr:gliding motility-associated C-terminal domain-containing protein [Bacteroidales bacterium]